MNQANNSNNQQMQPSSLFQNSATGTFGMPATDALSTIIDTTPVMNRQQQICDDSYPGFGDNSHHNTLTSPAPHSMYSSFNNNNAVVTNTTDPSSNIDIIMNNNNLNTNNAMPITQQQPSDPNNDNSTFTVTDTHNRPLPSFADNNSIYD
eukprot:CAMPEP_0201572658 /NCGR_PEP_ID=MMETSP0190_2-20130828/16073_1 /ASSEMBLY_ACC=CAM_ASM_000263 /TAXON_ID=37353 /ORGANISM="Rosalina sp." /LENGTH=149 /DNA_ID=CAMNT_0047998727 /DNA_START=373 /DNA_END=822 /DNA_ORIENTATION=+